MQTTDALPTIPTAAATFVDSCVATVARLTASPNRALCAEVAAVAATIDPVTGPRWLLVNLDTGVVAGADDDTVATTSGLRVAIPVRHAA